MNAMWHAAGWALLGAAVLWDQRLSMICLAFSVGFAIIAIHEDKSKS